MTTHNRRRQSHSSAQPAPDKENKRPRLSHETNVGSKDDACQQLHHVQQAVPKRGPGRPKNPAQPLQEIHDHVQAANQANQGGFPAVLNRNHDCISAADHDAMLSEQQRQHEEQLAIKVNKLNELQGDIDKMTALHAVQEAEHAQVVTDLQWKLNELQDDIVKR